jgi:CRISPR-associated protein Csx17
MTMHETPLGGCTPEPLMCYLKSLGILRLVAEQKDPNAQGCWRDGVFVLRSGLDKQALVSFMLDEYQPTALVVPWSGSDFFKVNRNGNGGPFGATPTAAKIIEAFLASTGARLSSYRRTILLTLSALDHCGIRTKTQMEDQQTKSRFIAQLRSTLDDSVVPWVDACAVLTDAKASFSALLGSGGGSDGNTHFSDNFMQNLWEVLPDFWNQKTPAAATASPDLLAAALFADIAPNLVPKRTSALFDGGAVGGPNAGQGFERVSLGNPWSIVLCLEGTIGLAGAAAKRYGTDSGGRAAFPFQVRLTPTRHDSASEKESAGREVWLPIWSQWSSSREVDSLFAEGRASFGRKHVDRGVDFARAAASLGVDRGIDAFSRFAVVRGRVGGENYNTSTNLGRFGVETRHGVDLLRELDPWLDAFRYAVTRDDHAPPRFRGALHEIESSIFEFCQYGGSSRFAEIVCALGAAEAEVARGEKFRSDNSSLRPLGRLSPEWIEAADDGSPEFELALALATIGDPEGKVGPIRSNLEPVQSSGRGWATADKAVVWSGTDLASNLVAVLQRRLMDADRKGCRRLPLTGVRSASLKAIARFLAADLDDEKIELLLRGLVLVESIPARSPIQHRSVWESLPLPRAYALLKLLLLPHDSGDGQEDVLKPEPATIALLANGRIGEACKLGARRLRAKGYRPIPGRSGRAINRDDDWLELAPDTIARRVAAALLFPVGSEDRQELRAMVLANDNDPSTAVR